jgi:hypothetical protein
MQIEPMPPVGRGWARLGAVVACSAACLGVTPILLFFAALSGGDGHGTYHAAKSSSRLSGCC